MKKHPTEIIILAAIGLRAARRALGKPEQIEHDGLGEWRMQLWCKAAASYLSGAKATVESPEYQKAAEYAREEILRAAQPPKGLLTA